MTVRRHPKRRTRDVAVSGVVSLLFLLAESSGYAASGPSASGRAPTAASQASVEAYFASIGVKLPPEAHVPSRADAVEASMGRYAVPRAGTPSPRLAMAVPADRDRRDYEGQQAALTDQMPPRGAEAASPASLRESSPSMVAQASADAASSASTSGEKAAVQLTEHDSPASRPVAWKKDEGLDESQINNTVAGEPSATKSAFNTPPTSIAAFPQGEMLAQASSSRPIIIMPAYHAAPSVTAPTTAPVVHTIQTDPVRDPADFIPAAASPSAANGGPNPALAPSSLNPQPGQSGQQAPAPSILDLNAQYPSGQAGSGPATGKTQTADVQAPAKGPGSAFPRNPSIAGNLTEPREERGQGLPAGQNQNQIPIINSHSPKRGININSEHPSVRHVKMAPASKKWGGDETEIVIAPIYDVMIQMPEAIEYFKSSSSLLQVSTVQTNPNLVVLKLSAVQGQGPALISLHLVDTSQNIYTFSVIGTPADIAYEYPKTIVVTKRMENKVKIGAQNPRSVIDAMDVEDAIQIVVGDVPNSNEYNVEFVSSRYMEYEGYAMYGFRVSRKDHGDFPGFAEHKSPDINFTIWANNHRLDAGNAYAASREIEWIVEPVLSKRETRRKGYQVLRVFVQIRASLLDLEEWTSAFITASNGVGYTRFDFPPLIREFRAPVRGADEAEPTQPQQ